MDKHLQQHLATSIRTILSHSTLTHCRSGLAKQPSSPKIAVKPAASEPKNDEKSKQPDVQKESVLTKKESFTQLTPIETKEVSKPVTYEVPIKETPPASPKVSKAIESTPISPEPVESPLDGTVYCVQCKVKFEIPNPRFCVTCGQRNESFNKDAQSNKYDFILVNVHLIYQGRILNQK